MPHSVQERIEDRLEELRFDIEQAQAYLRERRKIRDADPTPENIRESTVAFNSWKEAKGLCYWFEQEATRQRKERC
jgi:hypothetical protein